jgi:hypothetical protein
MGRTVSSRKEPGGGAAFVAEFFGALMHNEEINGQKEKRHLKKRAMNENPLLLLLFFLGWPKLEQ